MNFIPIAQIPDISFWQDNNATPQGVDFSMMRTKTEGLIIRAGQRNWIDSDFVTNWQASKAAGLQRGSYWFYDSRETPQKQADLWKIAIGNDLPEWGLWLDLEENYGGSFEGETNWKKFAEAVRAYFPNVPIGIYTGYFWWSGQTVWQSDYWATFPLWIAWYAADPDEVLLPKPWKTKGATLWQYTSSGDGAAYGAESQEIDLNHTSQSFYDLFGEDPPTVPPTNGETMYNCTVKASATPYVNIRESASGSSADIGNVYPGDTFQADALTNGFLHAVTPFTGYVSAQYVDYTGTPEPPPTSNETTIKITYSDANAVTGVNVDGANWVKQ